MPDFTHAARLAITPLLAMRVGGDVALRFLAPLVGAAGELGLVPDAPETFTDFVAAESHVRELTAEEIATLAGQFRQGAREVLLSHAFVENVAAAQGLPGAQEMFEAAAGALIGGQICRIRSAQPLDVGDGPFAWRLLCDAPLDT